MRNIQRWLYIFTILILLTSSCQVTETATIDTPSESDGVPFLKTLIKVIYQDNSPDVAEGNECLNCHSDKDLLIETARPVEATESESKGVG